VGMVRRKKSAESPLPSLPRCQRRFRWAFR